MDRNAGKLESYIAFSGLLFTLLKRLNSILNNHLSIIANSAWSQAPEIERIYTDVTLPRKIRFFVRKYIIESRSHNLFSRKYTTNKIKEDIV